MAAVMDSPTLTVTRGVLEHSIVQVFCGMVNRTFAMEGYSISYLVQHMPSKLLGTLVAYIFCSRRQLRRTTGLGSCCTERCCGFGPRAVLFENLVAWFLPPVFRMAKSKFLEGQRKGACSVAGNVFTALARGDEARVMNQRTEASATMKPIDEVKDSASMGASISWKVVTPIRL